MKLVKKNNDMKKSMNTLRNMEETLETDFSEMQPVTVYFAIGQSVLGDLELQHLDFYARNILEKVSLNPTAEITVMGSADSNTGTSKRNQYLSKARGEYIANLLSEKYGIDKSRVIITSETVKAKSKPEMNRAVIITFK